ncbi:MAG TPA: MBL fold metallo-hydrolase [Nitrobacter sp.]|nr:MBL fold metallo-hydrolase [Nitrobacter sp.]
MQVHFIGCGDAFGSGGRFNTCFHVTGERTNLLIDCGASSLVALKRDHVDLDKIGLILISHFHGDHFAGLPFFILNAQFSHRQAPLTIAGPPGLRMRLTQVMEALFENSSKTQQRFEINLVELRPGEATTFGAATVTPFEVVHGTGGGPFHAYRIESEGRIVTYSADTEWTETLVPAARHADLFICEAYTFDTNVRNHLSYATLAAQLPRIAPKRLVLTHMSEDVLARISDIPHIAAHDGLVIGI